MLHCFLGVCVVVRRICFTSRNTCFGFKATSEKKGRERMCGSRENVRVERECAGRESMSGVRCFAAHLGQCGLVHRLFWETKWPVHFHIQIYIYIYMSWLVKLRLGLPVSPCCPCNTFECVVALLVMRTGHTSNVTTEVKATTHLLTLGKQQRGPCIGIPIFEWMPFLHSPWPTKKALHTPWDAIFCCCFGGAFGSQDLLEPQSKPG